MDADKELKLKKAVFWELLAVAVLGLALVVALLVSGVKRKAPDETDSQQTGTSESLSSSASDTTTDTTDTTTDTTETTGETTETTETTEETTQTEETTEESVEQPSEETTEESEEPSEEESKEPEPSQPPATDPTLPPPAANPIRPEDIVKNGDYLTCQTAPTVVGIDVSEWQETVDWAQVKAAGIEFVMIRAGWRGNTSGKLNADAHAQKNYQGAAAAGLKIGAYFFSQAINVKEAQEEADFLLDAIKDWKLDMPVVFDWEYAGADARTGATTARTLTDCAKAFCNKIAAANLKPMVYFGANHARDRLYLSELTDYDFWFAQYNDTLDYPYKVDMWQYTNKGSVPGIKGNVDINLYFPWEE